MSNVTKLPTPVTPEVPTLQQLIAQRTTLVLQRASLKDQIEVIERGLPVLGGMISIQESYVKKDAGENTTKD